MKRALITGITGQDGSYLTELLLKKGYEVHGLVRRSSTLCRERLEEMHPFSSHSSISLHYGDMADGTSLRRVLEKVAPEETYNLAAQSHVRISFEMPEYTADIVGVGTIRLLEAIRETGLKTKFYQASSSEMFGNAPEIPQRETTPFFPRSPYAYAKVFAYWSTVNYREAYGIHACNGILFNHESPRRGENFVTRKITRSLARILAGKQKQLRLGNLEAKRDWGYAKDYVEAIWKILQVPTPDDYVIATGESHSVKEFLTIAFDLVGLDWKNYVVFDPLHQRPSEVDHLVGDFSKAKKRLHWTPSISFGELVRIMLEHDLTQENLDPKTYLASNPTRLKLSA